MYALSRRNVAMLLLTLGTWSIEIAYAHIHKGPMCIALNPSFSILDCITCMHYLHRDRDGEDDAKESVEVITSCSELLQYSNCTKKVVGGRRCGYAGRGREEGGMLQVLNVLKWINISCYWTMHYWHALIQKTTAYPQLSPISTGQSESCTKTFCYPADSND